MASSSLYFAIFFCFWVIVGMVLDTCNLRISSPESSSKRPLNHNDDVAKHEVDVMGLLADAGLLERPPISAKVADKCPDGYRRPFLNWNETSSGKKPRVYQVSGKFGYANRFEDDVKKHTAETISTGVFDADKVFGYYEFPGFIMNDTAWEANTAFLREGPKSGSAQGGGWWFWKAPLIYHHLQKIDDGDFLVYVDNDVRKHWVGLPILLETMVEQGKNLVTWGLPNRFEKHWTKRDVHEAYCGKSPEEDDDLIQYDAMFQVYRKDKATLQFVYQMLQGAKNLHAINNVRSFLPNFEFFRAHRRDQSVFNDILQCRYQNPERENYNQTCNWGAPLFLFNVPPVDASLLVEIINNTEYTLREHERLYNEATEEQRGDPHDPIWSTVVNRKATFA